MKEVYDQEDADGIEQLLVGRRIVEVERGEFPVDHGYATGALTLDNGVRILVEPNDGGCSCGAGDYDLTHLEAVDNIITSVDLDWRAGDMDSDYLSHYTIFVFADHRRINAVEVTGDDGSGYYGTGYRLHVFQSEATA